MCSTPALPNIWGINGDPAISKHSAIVWTCLSIGLVRSVYCADKSTIQNARTVQFHVIEACIAKHLGSHWGCSDVIAFGHCQYVIVDRDCAIIVLEKVQHAEHAHNRTIINQQTTKTTSKMSSLLSITQMEQQNTQIVSVNNNNNLSKKI